MPNDIEVTKNDVPGSKRWDVTYTADNSGLVEKTMLTDHTTLDRDIKVAVTIPAGSVTAPSSISGTDGTISFIPQPSSITITKDISVTPNVTAVGYIGSGIAGVSTVSLSAPVNPIVGRTITPTTTTQTIASSGGVYYISGELKVAGDSDLVASNIKNNVTIFGVTGNYSGETPSLQSKTITPTESEQNVTPDDGYQGLSSVKVNAISDTYIGSAITVDPTPTVSGPTVTIPTGYYSNTTSESVATTTVATPSLRLVPNPPSIMATQVQPAGYTLGGTTNNVYLLAGAISTTYTPTTSDQLIGSNGAGIYSVAAGAKVAGDANLVASNIKKDVTIFNVTGTYDNASVSPKIVNFIDYDGTLLYSYTAAEFNQLSDLPANPNHSELGLTAQGWNWTKAQITAQLTAMPDLPIWVGQSYVTTSGDTELDITLKANALNPYLTVGVSGTVTIDWGDNTSADTLAGSGLTTSIYQGHTYAAAGNYTIKIHVVSGSFRFRSVSNCSSPLRISAAETRSRAYSNTITAIRLGSNVSLDNYAFSYCEALKSITIPLAITSFGNYTFYYCDTLKTVVVPKNLTNLAGYVFQYCGIRTISLPGGLTTIGSNVFCGCNFLTAVSIPSSVTSLNTNMFLQCYALPGPIAIPSGVTIISSSLFASCNSLTSVTLPSTITSIGTSAFSSCRSLISVNLPSGITSIGNSAFSSCYSLTSLTVPSTVATIGTSAFANLYSAISITFLSTTPPTITNTNVFSGIQSYTKIYVPYSADHSVLNAYKTANYWSDYASYMEELPA